MLAFRNVLKKLPIHSLASVSQGLSSFSTLKSPCLTRDFINDRLYNPEGGYFCKHDIQIGELSSPIDFENLPGYEAYIKELAVKYPKNAWLTPSELFRPWYGITIGNYIHQAFLKATKKGDSLEKKPRIKIIEAGAGNGAAADGILSYFKNYSRDNYVDLQYKIVEISPQMCKKARERLEKEHKELLERNQLMIANEDFLAYKETDEELTFLLLFEVIDNMPHDRVYYSEEKDEWCYETWVEFDDKEGQKNLREIKKPISDSLIREAVDLLKTLPKTNGLNHEKKKVLEKVAGLVHKKKEAKNIFLPTCTLKMLKNIQKNLPNHHLVITDYDMLGTPKNKASINNPIVSKKLENPFDKQDFDSYLIKRGEADIFFPTDFQYLKHAYGALCEKNAEVYKTYEFMNRFSKTRWAESKSGYNPLKEDFLNTSIMTTKLGDNSE